MELSLLRTFIPGSESTMVWNFRSREQELLLQGTFAAWNFFTPGVKVLRIRGCISVLMFVLQTRYRRRQRLHNHHIHDTTLVSLTVILVPTCSDALQRLLLTSSHYCLDYVSI